MEKLFEASSDLQLSVLCGYIAYKIAYAGKNSQHKTEEFLVIILGFGYAANFIARSILWYFEYSNNSILNFLLSVIFAILLSSFWRKGLEELYISLMRKLNIYHDDHAISAFRSILTAKQKWTFIYIHLKDGRKFCTNFADLPKKLPLSQITINEDGVAIYVTDIYFPDKSHEKIKVEKSETGYVIDYIPASIIERYEIGWY